MSATEICNRALSRIGTRSTIASLSENSNEAEQCNILYSPTRDEVLSMAFWNFAKKTASLALVKSAPGTPTNPTGTIQWSSAYPAPPWLYEYAYPSDCIQMRTMTPQINTGVSAIPIMSNMPGAYPYVTGPAVRFEVAIDTDTLNNQINVILTNQFQAIGVYTTRITNTDLFSSQFTEALVCALAGKLAQPLTGDAALRRECFALANAQIVQARTSDGNEGLTVIDYQADWIYARSMQGIDGYGYWTSPYNPLYTVL